MKIKIAIFGLGVVGGGTLQLLQQNKSLIKNRTGCQFEITKIVVKNANKKRDLNLKNINLTTDANSVLQDSEINLIFEATGDEKLGLKIIKEATNNNKIVITANKALLAERWSEINTELCQNSAKIGFEAAVCGAIPIIDVLKNGLSANKITSIYGIINGTCNFILSKMEQEQVSFKTVLKEAQKLGYAEQDPHLDIKGIDAAHKLIIMINIIHGSVFDFSKLYIEGIDELEPEVFKVAKELGYKVKLLAISKKINSKIQAHVHPTLVPETHALANISGVDNAIFLKGDFSGHAMFSGAGAGSKATASAMVSDMVQLLKTKKTQNKIVSFTQNNFVEIQNLNFEYFIRFKVKDKIGVLKTVSSIFSDNSISVKSLLQIDSKVNVKKSTKAAELILITHLAQEKNLLKTIEQIKKIALSKPSFIRILN